MTFGWPWVLRTIGSIGTVGYAMHRARRAPRAGGGRTHAPRSPSRSSASAPCARRAVTSGSIRPELPFLGGPHHRILEPRRSEGVAVELDGLGPDPREFAVPFVDPGGRRPGAVRPLHPGAVADRPHERPRGVDRSGVGPVGRSHRLDQVLGDRRRDLVDPLPRRSEVDIVRGNRRAEEVRRHRSADVPWDRRPEGSIGEPPHDLLQRGVDRCGAPAVPLLEHRGQDESHPIVRHPDPRRLACGKAEPTVPAAGAPERTGRSGRRVPNGSGDPFAGPPASTPPSCA